MYCLDYNLIAFIDYIIPSTCSNTAKVVSECIKFSTFKAIYLSSSKDVMAASESKCR